MPDVAGVLDHLSHFDVLADDRCVEFFVQRLQDVATGSVELTDNSHRREVVVRNGGTFTQELRVYRNTEVDAGFLARAVFENRDDHVLHGAGQYGTAHNNGVTGGFFPQHKTDLAADRLDVVQFQVAVLLARGTHADHRQVGIADGRGKIRGAAQATGTDTLLQKCFQARFDNGRFAFVNQVDLGAGNINADDVVTPGREATGTDCTDITQTKNADTHCTHLMCLSCRVIYIEPDRIN
ncbi:hypothetical protein D3C76_551700 [compost metagenome]